jgi:hypothetical protein
VTTSFGSCCVSTDGQRTEGPDVTCVADAARALGTVGGAT